MISRSTALAGLTGAATAVLVLLPAGPVPARPLPAPSADGPALALLERAARAPRQTPYSGLQFVATWSRTGGESYLVEIDHLPDYGTAVRVQGTPATAGGGSFTSVSDESRSGGGLTPADDGKLAVLSRNYELTVGGAASVAGRPATRIDVRHPDGRVAARFWVDDAAGLLLRRETYDARGRTVRASAFVDVRLRPPGNVSLVSPAAPARLGRPVSGAELAGLAGKGWTCPGRLGAGLALYDARRDEGRHGSVLHLSYTDGLSAVSVFEQRGRLDPTGLAGFRRTRVSGAQVHIDDRYPQRVVWSARGKVFTVIADAPTDTVHAVVAGLPHDTARKGVAHRVGRGISRVGSWFNPFG